MRKLWVGLGACGLALTGIPASAASSDAPSSMTGRLFASDGKALSGVHVVLYAWPSNDVLRVMRVGDSAALTPIAVATTNTAGRFDLTPSSASLSRASDKYSNVNTELRMVFADGASALLSYSGMKSTSTSPASEESWVTSVGDIRLSHNIAGTRPARSLSLPGAPSCSTVFKADLGDRGVWVGGHYSNKSSISHDLTYSRGATSTLGVGVSSSGAFGSYKASGTATASSTAEEGYPSSTGRQHDYTNFDYGKYAVTCDGIPISYTVRVRYFSGGAWTYAPTSSPTATYCVYQEKGSHFTISSTSAYSYASGADTSGAIGIDLSSQTGYSSTAKISFSFNSNSNLCGTNAKPGQGTARRLVGK